MGNCYFGIGRDGQNLGPNPVGLMLSEPITLVLDNARYQRNAVVQALAAQLGITLFPPLSAGVRRWPARSLSEKGLGEGAVLFRANDIWGLSRPRYNVAGINGPAGARVGSNGSSKIKEVGDGLRRRTLA